MWESALLSHRLWHPPRSALWPAFTLPVCACAGLYPSSLCLRSPGPPGLPHCHPWISMICLFESHESLWSIIIQPQFPLGRPRGGHWTPQLLVAVDVGNLVPSLSESWGCSLSLTWISTLGSSHHAPKQPSSWSNHDALVPGRTSLLLAWFWSALDAPRGGVAFKITQI